MSSFFGYTFSRATSFLSLPTMANTLHLTLLFTALATTLAQGQDMSAVFAKVKNRGSNSLHHTPTSHDLFCLSRQSLTLFP